MRIEDFVNRLERLGFKDSGFRHPSNSWLRSYDPPAWLTVLVSLNIGSAGDKFAVSVQGRDYAEMGGHFPMLKPDEKLLTALKSGDEGFLRWFSSQVAFTGTVGNKQIVGTADGAVHPVPETVN